MPWWFVILTSWDCSCLLKTKKRTFFYGAAGAANPFRYGVESLQTQIYWQEREETEETDWFVHWKTRCKQEAGARRQVKGSSWQTQQENPTNTRMPTVTRLSHPDLSWGFAAHESLDILAYSKNNTTWDLHMTSKTRNLVFLCTTAVWQFIEIWSSSTRMVATPRLIRNNLEFRAIFSTDSCVYPSGVFTSKYQFGFPKLGSLKSNLSQ